MDENKKNNEVSDRYYYILDVAIKLFSEKGFDKTTTKEIAKEALIAEGTIFRYFSTKRDILLGVLETLGKQFTLNSFEQVFTDYQNKTFESFFYDLTIDNLKRINNALPVLKIIAVQAFTDNEMRSELFKAVDKGYGVQFYEAIDFYKSTKKIRADANVSAIIKMITSVILFHVIECNILQKEIYAEISEIINIILCGIKETKPKK